MFKKIDCFTLKKDENYTRSILYKSFSQQISSIKNNIDDYVDIWEKIKRISNPYELIYINYKEGISNIFPISRSFFKMIELLNKYSLLDNGYNNVACLAEGPGGFIEALNYYSEKKQIMINIHGLTLPPVKKGIPSWKKIHNIKNKKITVTYGNLYNKEDLIKYNESFFQKEKAFLVTADGGIDYSSDYNKQEQLSYKIIFSEIVTSFMILKKGGVFVCKIFDIFSVVTLKLLKLIDIYFEKFEINKPNTSRVLNSEKYIIATNFKGIDKKDLNKLINLIEHIDENTADIKEIKIDNNFVHRINKINNKFCTKQINYLNKALIIAKNDICNKDRKDIINKQIKNAVKWCTDNNIPINKKSKYLN